MAEYIERDDSAARERLIELLKDGGVRDFPFVAALADRLLSNGVIVPPCKVNDAVWCLVPEIDQVFKGRVHEIVCSYMGIVLLRCSLRGYFARAYDVKEFGKTIFTNKEQAEKALETRKKR